jgi:Myb-like DNA-binding protein REB1
LTTKWLTARQLAALAHTQGICYRKGRFSAEENQQVRMAIQAYQQVRHSNFMQWRVLFIPRCTP